jgi:hypothetical protein
MRLVETYRVPLDLEIATRIAILWVAFLRANFLGAFGIGIHFRWLKMDCQSDAWDAVEPPQHQSDVSDQRERASQLAPQAPLPGRQVPPHAPLHVRQAR